MKKILLLLALVIPLTAMAQLGGLLKTPKLNTRKVEVFTEEVKIFEAKVDTAGDLLYTATDKFFAILDSAITLPSLSEVWTEVKAGLKSAATEEAKTAAEGGYLKYLNDTDARKATLDSLWLDDTVRTAIVGHLINQKDNLVPVKDELETALQVDKAAIGRYDKIFNAGKAAITDLTNQIAANPLAAVSTKPVLDEGKEALRTFPTLKKTANRHVKLATYILDKIKEVF